MGVNLLTWHGAILRIDRGRLVQDPLWLTAKDGGDFTFEQKFPSLPGLGSARAEASTMPGLLRITNGSFYLSAPPNRRDLLFEPDESHAWQNFLGINETDLADLRHILSHRWRLRPSNEILEKTDIRLVAGLRLELGPSTIDLAAAFPLVSLARRPAAIGEPYQPPPSFLIPHGDTVALSMEIADGAAAQLAPGPSSRLAANQPVELVMRRVQPGPEVTSTDAFQHATLCRFTLPSGAPRFTVPPIMLRARDAELFRRHATEPGGSRIGVIAESCTIRRESQRYVMLNRGCEGLVFNSDGTSSDLWALDGAPRLPNGISRRAGGLWIDRAALAEAPRIEGPHLVFYDNRIDGYRAFLTGAMPALDLISRHVPRNSRLLLPGHFTRMSPNALAYDTPFAHRETMARLGFGQLPASTISADIALAEDVIYMDRPTPADIPATQLREFRDRVLVPFDGPGEPTRRLYLKRGAAGGVEPRHEIETFLSQQGFEHIQLEHTNFDAQMRMFREAAFVVAPYCGGSANIVFSTPGLRVLELMDERSFKPESWQLCSKLGYLYGFLGCPTRGRDAEMRLVPDLERFKALFGALEGYK
jgi:hypothetical protein